MSLKIEVSVTINQNTSAIDHLQKQYQHEKEQSAEFQINLSETHRLADERNSAQRDSQLFRQKVRR